MGKKIIEVVKGMDLKRYTGRWYQIASFSSRFQPKSGTNTRATYTLRDDEILRIMLGVILGYYSGLISGWIKYYVD